MDPVTWIATTIDPFLIAPYRWFSNPMIGWWVGTALIALWAVLLGELTLAVVYRVNRQEVTKTSDRTLYYHRQALQAKRCGDESAYRGINTLANDAFGKSFFLLIAMSMASLWPAFFAAAWLNARFGQIGFALPPWAGGIELSFLAPFVVLYVGMRWLMSRLKPFLGRAIRALRPSPSTKADFIGNRETADIEAV